jgi:hypothetical protein
LLRSTRGHEHAFTSVAQRSTDASSIALCARCVSDQRKRKFRRAVRASSRNDVGRPTFPSRHPCNRIDDVARRTPRRLDLADMSLLAGLLGYLAMLALLIGGGILALLALSGVATQSKVATYGAPTRVRAPSEFAIAAPQVPERIGPPVVHRAPEPPSQAALAKLRLQAGDRDIKQSVSAQRRTRAPPADAAKAAAPEPAPFDARHSGNF